MHQFLGVVLFRRGGLNYFLVARHRRAAEDCYMHDNFNNLFLWYQDKMETVILFGNGIIDSFFIFFYVYTK